MKHKLKYTLGKGKHLLQLAKRAGTQNEILIGFLSTLIHQTLQPRKEKK